MAMAWGQTMSFHIIISDINNYKTTNSRDTVHVASSYHGMFGLLHCMT